MLYNSIFFGSRNVNYPNLYRYSCLYLSTSFMETLYLPKKFRKEFRKVWGQALFGKKQEVIRKYKRLVEEKNYKQIITVGDYCSLVLPSDIKIFDGKIQRKQVKNLLGFSNICHNPPGTIQKEVWPVIRKAINDNQNVFVDGEEDLLVLPCVLLSKNRTAIVYGFPNKGICLIEVSQEVKNKFKQLLKIFTVRD